MRSRLSVLGLVAICASALACGTAESTTAAPLGQVTGTLANPTTGQPVAGFKLGLGHEVEDASGVARISRDADVASVTTDGTGRFDFRAVPEGTYIVVVASSGAPLVLATAYDAARSGGSGGGPVYYVSSSSGTIAVPWPSMKFGVKADAPSDVGQVYCTDAASCPK